MPNLSLRFTLVLAAVAAALVLSVQAQSSDPPQLITPDDTFDGSMPEGEYKWFYVEGEGSLPYEVEVRVEDGSTESTEFCWGLDSPDCDIVLPRRSDPTYSFGLLPGEKIYFRLSPGAISLIGDWDWEVSISIRAIQEMETGWDNRQFDSVNAGAWDFWYIDVPWETTELTALLDVSLLDTWAVDVYLNKGRPPTINDYTASATNLSFMALAQAAGIVDGDDPDRALVEVIEGRERLYVGVYGAGCTLVRCTASEYNFAVNLVEGRQIDNKRLPYLITSVALLAAGCTMCTFVGVRRYNTRKDLRSLYDEHPALYVPSKPWYKRIKWESSGRDEIATQYVGGEAVTGKKDDNKSLLAGGQGFQADYAGLGDAVAPPPAYTPTADGASQGSRRKRTSGSGSRRTSGSGSRRGGSRSRGGRPSNGSGGSRRRGAGGSSGGSSGSRRRSNGSKRHGGGGSSGGSKRSGGSRRGQHDARPHTTATQASGMTRAGGSDRGSGRRAAAGPTSGHASGMTLAANPYSNVGFTAAQPKLGTGLGAGADADAARINAVARLKVLRTMPVWMIGLVLLTAATFVAMGFTTYAYLNPSLFEVSLCGFYIPEFEVTEFSVFGATVAAEAEVLMIFRARNVNAVTVFLDNISLDLYTRDLFLGSVVSHPGNFAPGETRLVQIPIDLDFKPTTREDVLALVALISGQYDFRLVGDVEFSVPNLRLDFGVPLDVALSLPSTGSGSGAYFGCVDPVVLFGGNGLEA